MRLDVLTGWKTIIGLLIEIVVHLAQEENWGLLPPALVPWVKLLGLVFVTAGLSHRVQRGVVKRRNKKPPADPPPSP